MKQKVNKPTYDAQTERLRELETAEQKHQARETALREHEAHYRSLVEDLPTLICSFLPDGTITFVNQAYCDYFSKTYAELVGAKFLTLIPEADRKTVLDRISALSAVTPTQVQEHPVLTPDGDTRWLRWINRALFDDSGAVTHYQSIGEDVTESRLAQAQLAESEARLAEAQRIAKVGSFRQHISGEIRYLSRELSRILGYGPEQPPPDYQSFARRIHPDDREAVDALSTRALSEGVGVATQFRYCLPDGGIRHISVRAEVVFDTAGKPEYLIGTAQDTTEIQETAQALQESEQYLKRAQEAGKVGVWKLDMATNRVTMSTEFARIHGLEGNECLMDELITLVPEADRQTVQTKIDTALIATGEYDLEHRIIHQKSEEICWVHARGRSILNKTGAMVALTGTSQDITARKRAERVLRQKQEELDLIYNTTSDVMALISVHPEEPPENRYRFASFNMAYWIAIRQQNNTITRDTLQGITLPELGQAMQWPRELVDDILQNYQTVIQSGSPLTRVEIIPHTRGSLYLNSTYTPIFSAEDVCTHILFNAHDITKIEEGRLALQKSEKMFRQVTETIQDVFWMSTPGIKEMIYVSPAFEKIWGLGTDQLYASPQTFIDAIHPDDLAAYLEVVELAHAKGLAYNYEYRIHPGSNNQRWIQERGFPITDAEGQVTQMTGICTDISERKRVEAERGKLQAQLLQAQKMESIGSLAGGIAHDFNNILSSIIGFTELAIEDVPPESMLADNLREVFQSGIRAKKLVKQILSFARQSEEEIKPIQPSAIAKEVLKFIRSSIPSNIEIHSVLGSDSLIMGNATQMHQILMNLCTNGAQAMEAAGGRLCLELRDARIDPIEATQLPGLKSGDYLNIDIRDSGCGIPPNLIASIFEPYFTTKEPGEGTGLGLAVVHGIVDSYGGKIFVESERDKGTVFHIYLPLAKTRRLEPPRQAEVLPTGTERILFVDDEAPIARIGSQVLERLGYTVTTRTSSVEALEIFRSKPDAFDLVITDMTMPNMTGDELAEEIAGIRPDIGIILCTGYSKKIPAQGTGQNFIRAIAYKPIVRADLAIIVRKVLDGSVPGP